MSKTPSILVRFLNSLEKELFLGLVCHLLQEELRPADGEERDPSVVDLSVRVFAGKLAFLIHIFVAPTVRRVAPEDCRYVAACELATCRGKRHV